MSLPRNKRPKECNLMLSPSTIHPHFRLAPQNALSITHIILVLIEQMGKYRGRMGEPELPTDFALGGVEMSSFVFFREVDLKNGEFKRDTRQHSPGTGWGRCGEAGGCGGRTWWFVCRGWWIVDAGAGSGIVSEMKRSPRKKGLS
eukprot:CCRYP_012786-RE/>CCRYP_012786-RE protein AED:0.46 eAED:1.00 QI:0/0/0/1/0/0/2/0/144